jgi:hypothetical protein
MMWTSKNLMWKFNFDTQVLKLTPTYGSNYLHMDLFCHP